MFYTGCGIYVGLTRNQVACVIEMSMHGCTVKEVKEKQERGQGEMLLLSLLIRESLQVLIQIKPSEQTDRLKNTDPTTCEH